MISFWNFTLETKQVWKLFSNYFPRVFDRESIIIERVLFFFILFAQKRDSRQVYGVRVLGRKDKFPEVLHVQRVMTGSFLRLESARATDWQDEFSFYFPLPGSGEEALLASTTRAIPSGQK